MITMRCEACGAEAYEGAVSCDDCGRRLAPAEPRPEPAIPRHELWRMAMWGAGALTMIALGALAVVVVGTLTRTPASTNAEATTTTTSTTTTLPPDEPIQALELVDVPVSAPVTIEAPPIDRPARIHHGGQIVVFEIDGNECGSGGGSLGASGTITNLSPVDQALTFALTVDLIRSTTGSRLERQVVDVGGLAAGDTATWEVRASSPRKVNVRCIVREVTVAPVD